MTKLNTFIFKDELYIRLVPGKALFNSTMIHEIINRGDVLAMKVSDQTIRIIPGKEQVEHQEHTVSLIDPSLAEFAETARKAGAARVKAANLVLKQNMENLVRLMNKQIEKL